MYWKQIKAIKSEPTVHAKPQRKTYLMLFVVATLHKFAYILCTCVRFFGLCCRCSSFFSVGVSVSPSFTLFSFWSLVSLSVFVCCSFFHCCWFLVRLYLLWSVCVCVCVCKREYHVLLLSKMANNSSSFTHAGDKYETIYMQTYTIESVTIVIV